MRTNTIQASLSRRRFAEQLTAGVSAGWMSLRSLRSSAAATEKPSELGDYDIWDLHCHLFGVGGITARQRVEKLIEYANRMGINRLVFFMGFPPVHDPTPAEMRRQNDQVMSVVDAYRPRVLGLVYLNPRCVEESLAELNRCVAQGPLVGVKLWVAERCHSPELDPLVQQTIALHGIVYQHTWQKATGNLPGESTPSDLTALARRHPQAMLVCGHTGGDWELGIRAVQQYPNVLIETGGFDPSAGMIEMAVRDLGADRILFGSDVGGRSFASQLGKVFGAQISEQDKRLILAGNLKRVLGPILRSKGWS